MKDLSGKVAVVTGGASGIGKAMANRFVSYGMRVVIADIESKTLNRTADELKEKGRVLAVNMDVSKREEMEGLLSKALDEFGEVHVLCSNAGVAVNKAIWQFSEEDWEWVLGVNLWGVIHALSVFVPVMLKQKSECHIVTTSSLHGFCSVPFHAPYVISKHAIIALNEILHRELKLKKC